MLTRNYFHKCKRHLSSSTSRLVSHFNYPAKSISDSYSKLYRPRSLISYQTTNLIYSNIRSFSDISTSNTITMGSTTAADITVAKTNESPSLPEDVKYDWFEDVDGEKVLTWVKSENKKCLSSKFIPKIARDAVVNDDNLKGLEQTDLYKRILSVLDSKEKIQRIRKIGKYYYNFWQDDVHIRGLWRRVPVGPKDNELENYYKACKDSSLWEVVIDVDELGKKENQSWVWGGHTLLEPDLDRTLVKLSPGGSDACIYREFDIEKKEFVDPEGVEKGFAVPEGKSRVSWRGRNQLFIGTKFPSSSSNSDSNGDSESGADNGLTDSGYPRITKLWERGTELFKSEKEGGPKMIFAGRQEDVSIGGYQHTWKMGSESDSDNMVRYDIIQQSLTFYTTSYYYLESVAESDSKPDLTKILVPEDVNFTTYFDHAVVKLRKKWGDYEPGTLLIASFQKVLEKSRANKGASTTSSDTSSDILLDLFEPLFTPTDLISLDDYEFTKNYILVHALNALKPEITAFPRQPASVTESSKGSWLKNAKKRETSSGGSSSSSSFSTLSISAIETDESDDLWVNLESFTEPSTLYKCTIDQLIQCTDDSKMNDSTSSGFQKLQSQPAFYNATGVTTQQHWVISKDGTRVPYFLVGKDLDLFNSDSKPPPRPTLLYGYGGFEISFPPYYPAVTGLAWLEKGNLFALANIRGGGEFGPKWHQAALKENRHKCYEDFEAVGRHLIEVLGVTSGNSLSEEEIERGVGSNGMLYCMGGSNGGLLTGNMLARHTREGTNSTNNDITRNLFSKIVCQCPLLDMKRFHKLLAGASWMAEYGNPDTEWETIKNYSPLQMLSTTQNSTTKKSTYPSILFTTSTKDDRVHPGHARKMVKKLQDVSGTANEVFYYENIEGGHSCAADNRQRAFMKTLEFEFLNGEKV